MFISGTVLWFILALIVAAVEMVTGTVYLLAVTLACAAAGAASWLGLSASWQFAVCALVTVIGCALAHLLRRRKNPQADRLMNLDEGERIRVESVGTAAPPSCSTAARPGSPAPKRAISRRAPGSSPASTVLASSFVPPPSSRGDAYFTRHTESLKK